MCVCVRETTETQPLLAALLLRRSQTNLRLKFPLGTGEEKKAAWYFLLFSLQMHDGVWLQRCLPSLSEGEESGAVGEEKV